MNEAEFLDLEAAEQAACASDANALSAYVQRMAGAGIATVHALGRVWYAARATRRAAQEALIRAKLESPSYDYMHKLGLERLHELALEAEKDAMTMAKNEALEGRISWHAK